METEIIVKKKGQTTIPVRIRKKLKIEEGTRLELVETDGGILLKPKKSIWDMIGAFSDQVSVEEINQLHYKLRHDEENE
jgi:AbrB family looped-hinge helix DNA binding protein